MSITDPSPRGQVPRAQGFRMPAEWEPHASTWLAFPHNAADWPGRFAPIPWVYGEIIRRVTAGEIVNLLVNDAVHEDKARRVLYRVGARLSQVVFHRFATNRIWTRDSGPIFVVRGDARNGNAKNGDAKKGEVAIARFRFTAWAKYTDFEKDDAIPLRAAEALQKQVLPVRYNDRDVVLEGGSIDVNGAGSILTTEECLLDPRIQVRNPGYAAKDYERVFGEVLGAPNTIWLGKGIAGDDTHGHVDDLCRFVSRTTVVLCAEQNPRDANYHLLNENRERLASARLEDGSRPEVVPLPMPEPVVFRGQRLPASYANFYICNAAVLVPTFNDANDRRALGILAELIPHRPVIGIHAMDLVWGLGTLHCLSQQEPAAP